MNRQELLDSLAMVKPGLSNFDLVPILTHFCFSEGTVLAYNDVLAIEAEVDIDLDCGVPGDVMLSMLGSMKTKDIEVEQSDAEILIKAGRSKAKLAVLPKEDYLFKMPATKSADKLRVGPDFINGLRKCLISVGDDPTHPEQTGIVLIASKAEVSLYSTDNKTLSKYEVDEEYDIKSQVLVILTKEFCDQLVAISTKLPKNKIDLFIDTKNDYVIASFEEEVTVYSKLLDDSSVSDFDSILDKFSMSSKSFVPIPADLKEATARAQIILKSAVDKELHIAIKKRTLQVEAKSSFGEVKEPIAMSKSFDETTFIIDSDMFARPIDSCKDISFQQGAVLFRDEAFIHLVSHFE